MMTFEKNWNVSSLTWWCFLLTLAPVLFSKVDDDADSNTKYHEHKKHKETLSKGDITSWLLFVVWFNHFHHTALTSHFHFVSEFCYLFRIFLFVSETNKQKMFSQAEDFSLILALRIKLNCKKKNEVIQRN